jgi:ABC-type uncharacterized transport system substrate-binding protein
LRKKTTIYFLVLIILCLFISASQSGVKSLNTSLSPIANKGKKWRVAYCGMRKSINHPWNFQAIVYGLNALGWIRLDQTFPWPKTGQTDSSPMWKWLSAREDNPYIEFLEDGFYYTEGTDPKKCAQIADRIIDRSNREKDIDLIIVMGTKAAQSLANDRHSVPMMIFSTTDPISAGVTKSVKDSGRDHVWAHLYPTRQRRHIEVFHDIIGFKKLGMVFEDSVLGRSFAGIEQVQNVARERGFSIITRNVEEKHAGQEAFEKKTIKAYEELAGQVDALYLTIYAARKFDALSRLLKPFYDHKIPIFTQVGMEVRYGALMSVSDGTDLKGFGRFAGESIVKVFHGEKPRHVPYVYEHPPRIMLNMDVSRIVGYRPPFDILLVADEIYSTRGGSK